MVILLLGGLACVSSSSAIASRRRRSRRSSVHGRVPAVAAEVRGSSRSHSFGLRGRQAGFDHARSASRAPSSRRGGSAQGRRCVAHAHGGRRGSPPVPVIHARSQTQSSPPSRSVRGECQPGRVGQRTETGGQRASLQLPTDRAARRPSAFGRSRQSNSQRSSATEEHPNHCWFDVRVRGQGADLQEPSQWANEHDRAGGDGLPREGVQALGTAMRGQTLGTPRRPAKSCRGRLPPCRSVRRLALKPGVARRVVALGGRLLASRVRGSSCAGRGRAPARAQLRRRRGGRPSRGLPRGPTGRKPARPSESVCSIDGHASRARRSASASSPRCAWTRAST